MRNQGFRFSNDLSASLNLTTEGGSSATRPRRSRLKNAIKSSNAYNCIFNRILPVCFGVKIRVGRPAH